MFYRVVSSSLFQCKKENKDAVAAAVLPLVAGHSRTSISGSTADWRGERRINSQLQILYYIQIYPIKRITSHLEKNYP